MTDVRVDAAAPGHNRPLVSIVTPTLQRAEFLERTLRSLRAQTYPHVEHIVVDGGSTDGTIELLERYAPTYDLRWISEPDRGMYDAVNKGLRMARGEILAYLNSDDLYFPWSVAAGVKAFADHPEAGLVYGDVLRRDALNGWVVPVFTAPLKVGPTAAFGTLHQPAVFWRREVFNALGGFDDSLAYVADLAFWLRAASRFEHVAVAEFLAFEERHADMLSETRRAEMAAEDARVRRLFRGGLWASELGEALAHARWHVWCGWYWWGFARAARGRGRGWTRVVQACRPRVDARTATVGLLPSKASRLRRTIRWSRDPLAIASAAPLEEPGA